MFLLKIYKRENQNWVDKTYIIIKFFLNMCPDFLLRNITRESLYKLGVTTIRREKIHDYEHKNMFPCGCYLPRIKQIKKIDGLDSDDFCDIYQHPILKDYFALKFFSTSGSRSIIKYHKCTLKRLYRKNVKHHN